MMNKFAQLVNQTPEQASQHLAHVLLLSRSMRKAGADVSQLWNDASTAVSGAAKHVGGKLSKLDPAYTAGAGAIGLGGLAALRERLKPKAERRYENAALGAGIGGLLGAAPGLSGFAFPASKVEPNVKAPPSGIELAGATKTVAGKVVPDSPGHRIADAAANYADAVQSTYGNVPGLRALTSAGKSTGELLTGEHTVNNQGQDARTGGLLAKVPQGTLSGGMGSLGIRAARGVYHQTGKFVNPAYKPGPPGWLGRAITLAPLALGAASDVNNIIKNRPQ